MSQRIRLSAAFLAACGAGTVLAQQQQPPSPTPDGRLDAVERRLSVGWVPLLICLGLFVAFLTLLTPQLASQRVAIRIDCRGPPVL